MTCTVRHNTGMPSDTAAIIHGTPPRRPMRWRVQLTVIDATGRREQLEGKTTAPIQWGELSDVVGSLIDIATADLRAVQPDLLVSHVEWIATCQGGSSKNRKGRKGK